jgi:hypothetical protein
MDEWNLQGGVLIIGSLLWQDHLNEPGDNRRKNWRRDHLKEFADFFVRVPIRYGRRSRGGIYTMTFANSVRQIPGIGVVRPFLANPMRSLEALKKEAQALSVAEGMQEQFIRSDQQNRPWSVLAILLNPRKVTTTQKEHLLNWWSTQLQAEETSPNFHVENFSLGNEEPCVGQNGALNIPWIQAVNRAEQTALDQYDFLLATATLATGPDYPDSRTLETSARQDSGRDYFLNNYIHGIRTFQDEEILAASEPLRQRLAFLKMTVERLTTALKAQFREISAAFFEGSIRLQEIEATDHVFAEASPMFGENILRYSPTNFRYFYRVEKYMCNAVDLVNLKVIEKNLPKLAVTSNILTLSATEQIVGYENKNVPSPAQFVEYNIILNLFVFLHECGHLNQHVSEGN